MHMNSKRKRRRRKQVQATKDFAVAKVMERLHRKPPMPQVVPTPGVYYNEVDISHYIKEYFPHHESFETPQA